MVEKVWSKYLYTKWQTKEIRTQELRTWFPKLWRWVCQQKQSEGTQIHTKTYLKIIENCMLLLMAG